MNIHRPTAADLLEQYGQAIHNFQHNSGGIDEMRNLTTLAELVRLFGSRPLPPAALDSARFELVLCPRGEGHWDFLCADHAH